MNKPLIDIIGAGPGGLAAALCLQKEGMDFQLFEKSAEISYKKVGLGISNNILPILEKWGVLSDTKEIGAEIKRLVFADNQLKTLKVFALPSSPWSVNRQQFHHLLYSRLAKNTIHLNTEWQYQDIHPERITIIADGINSPVRERLFPNISLRRSGQLIFRGICELDAYPEMRNSYFDLIGNALRFALIDTGKNWFSWYAIVPISRLSTEGRGKAVLLDLFSDYHPLVIQAIENTRTFYVEELKDIDPRSRKSTPWYDENMIFIGDAIHATTPNLANGACLAMEDADQLVGLLKHHIGEYEEVFKAFQKSRRAKVDRIVKVSWLLGKSLHWNNKWTDPILYKSIKYTPQWLFNELYSSVLK